MIKREEYKNELDRLNVEVHNSSIVVERAKKELVERQERFKRALSDYIKVANQAAAIQGNSKVCVVVPESTEILNPEDAVYASELNEMKEQSTTLISRAKQVDPKALGKGLHGDSDHKKFGVVCEYPN